MCVASWVNSRQLVTRRVTAAESQNSCTAVPHFLQLYTLTPDQSTLPAHEKQTLINKIMMLRLPFHNANYI